MIASAPFYVFGKRRPHMAATHISNHGCLFRNMNTRPYGVFSYFCIRKDMH